MRIFLIGIAVLTLFILVFPVFLSSRFSMSRSIEIAAPISVVFSRLTDLHDYVKWNPFSEGDTTHTSDVSGTGVGSVLVWKGERTGEGRMTLISIMPERKVIVEMEFYKPISSIAKVHWTTTAESELKTQFVWSFEQNLSYFRRYFGLFMDSMMGKYFEKGLSSFKEMVESEK